MSQLWQSVPQVRWAGARVESQQDEMPVEPSVTANVAVVGAETSEPQPTGKASVDTSSIPRPDESSSGQQASKRFPHGFGRTNPPASSDSVSTESRPVPALSAATIAQEETSEDQIERLRAAMNDDARRATESNRLASASNDMRIRVESLLERARRLFDVGQLTEARRTAQLAQELGETARLDYSPDEERPIDLVHQIEDQLQSVSEMTGDASLESDERPEEKRNATDDVAQSSGGEPQEESTNRSWLRGYGVNVFRRDRKSSVPEHSQTAEVKPDSTHSSVVSSPVSLGVEFEDEQFDDRRNGVVQANRSVRLSTALQQMSSSPAVEVDSNNKFTQVEHASNSWSDTTSSALRNDDESSRPLEPMAEGPALALQNQSIEEQSRDPEASEIAPSPPELEDVRPISPFRNVARATRERHTSVHAPTEKSTFSWGWCIGFVGLGVCTTFAVACYRRGAT